MENITMLSKYLEVNKCLKCEKIDFYHSTDEQFKDGKRVLEQAKKQVDKELGFSTR